MDQRPPDSLVLLSGGLDSTACLQFYVDLGVRPSCLFIDYGQPARAQERQAAERICEHYAITLRTLSVPVVANKSSLGFLRGRNLMLASIALCWSPASVRLIAMGIHTVDEYPDCGPSFVTALQRVFDTSVRHQVRFAAPFVDWSKNEVWAFAQQHGVPVPLTRSCEAATVVPCGQCNSCLDRERLDASTPARIHSS